MALLVLCCVGQPASQPAMYVCLFVRFDLIYSILYLVWTVDCATNLSTQFMEKKLYFTKRFSGIVPHTFNSLNRHRRFYNWIGQFFFSSLCFQIVVVCHLIYFYIYLSVWLLLLLFHTYLYFRGLAQCQSWSRWKEFQIIFWFRLPFWFSKMLNVVRECMCVCVWQYLYSDSYYGKNRRKKKINKTN